MCPHRFAATRGIRRGARPASGLSWESVEARSLEESGGEDSERPASKKTGPPQDGRARLGTDRPASGWRHVNLLEELDDGVEGDAHARPEVVAPLHTGESQSQFRYEFLNSPAKVADSCYKSRNDVQQGRYKAIGQMGARTSMVRGRSTKPSRW